MKKPYEVDEETQELIEVALNCLVTLADAQIQEESKIGLLAIADGLAEAFGVSRLDVEVHEGDDGEEIIYRPPTDLFDKDDDEEEPRGA